MLSIVPTTTADIPLIRKLTMQVWPQTYVPIIGPDQVAYMLDQFYTPQSLTKQMEESKHSFILCYDDNRPVAFASFSETEAGVYKLHKLYILPGCQGRGIGRFMINYIAGDIKAKGAASLQLNVNIYNHAAKSFYERTGFKHLRDEDIDIGGGFFMNDHVLQLPL